MRVVYTSLLMTEAIRVEGAKKMIRVIGIGPGNPDYILPIAIKAIEKAKMVIGTTRHIDAVKGYCQETLDYAKGFDYIGQYLKNYKEEEIAIAVSGDALFYSMLNFVKRTVDHKWIEVIPGISSLQYMYAKLKRGYESAKWISYHGREVDVIQEITNHKSVGILTDRHHSPAYIARELYTHNIDNRVIYIGENLSYEDECIRKMTIEEAMAYEANPLSVVVIEYDR